MKTAVVVLLTAALTGCSAWGNNTAQAAALQKQVDSLSAKVKVLEARSTAASDLDLQSRCAADAKRAFDMLGWGASKPVRGFSAGFTDHYNSALRRCFWALQLQSLTSPFEQTTFLADANEHVTFGTLIIRGDKVQTCDMTPTSETKHCSSKQEFDDYVASYMGTVAR